MRVAEQSATRLGQAAIRTSTGYAVPARCRSIQVMTMNKVSNEQRARRRRFLTGMGMVATGATLAAGAQTANAQGLDGDGYKPPRHAKDAWLAEHAMGKEHRVFIDSASGVGGTTALNYANNILLGHREDYGGQDSDYAMIVCFRHAATSLGYDDAMWEKYGDVFSRVTRITMPGSDEAPRMNPMNMEVSSYGNRGNTLDIIRNRGIQYAVCSKATRSMANRIAGSTGASAEDIFQELLQHNIRTSRFVPAGVVATTRSQEYGYSLLYAG